MYAFILVLLIALIGMTGFLTYTVFANKKKAEKEHKAIKEDLDKKLVIVNEGVKHLTEDVLRIAKDVEVHNERSVNADEKQAEVVETLKHVVEINSEKVKEFDFILRQVKANGKLSETIAKTLEEEKKNIIKIMERVMLNEGKIEALEKLHKTEEETTEEVEHEVVIDEEVVEHVVEVDGEPIEEEKPKRKGRPKKK